jgi:hypothetical protein
LKGLKKTMKNVNRDLQFPCADFLSIIAAWACLVLWNSDLT